MYSNKPIHANNRAQQTHATPTFFQLFTQSTKGKAIQNKFQLELNSHVIHGDLEGRLAFLRNKKATNTESFSHYEYYNIWTTCSDAKGSVNHELFLLKLQVILSRPAETDDLSEPFTYVLIDFLVEMEFITIQKTVSQPADKPDDTATDTDIPFDPHVFLPHRFPTPASRISLRNEIARSLDLSETQNSEYGAPNRRRIRMTSQYRWFFILQALHDARVLAPEASDTAVLTLLSQWFPAAFPAVLTPDQLRDLITRTAKSVSAERRRWINTDGTPIPLEQMHSFLTRLNIKPSHLSDSADAAIELRSALSRLPK